MTVDLCFAAFGTAQPLPPPAAPNLAPQLDTPPSVKCPLKLARFHAKCSRRAFIAEGVQYHHTAAAFIQRANGKAHRLALNRVRGVQCARAPHRRTIQRPRFGQSLQRAS